MVERLSIIHALPYPSTQAVNDFQIRKCWRHPTRVSTASLEFVRHFGEKGEALLERTSQLFAPFYQSKDFYAKGAIGYQAKYALFHSQVTFNAFCSGDRVPKLCFEIFFYALLRHAVSLHRSLPYL